MCIRDSIRARTFQGGHGFDLRRAREHGGYHPQIETSSTQEGLEKMNATLSTQSQATQTLSWNMKLISHHELAGLAGLAKASTCRSRAMGGASSGSRTNRRRRTSPQ